MAARKLAIFDTEIGQVAVVWSARGLVGVQLPQADERGIRSRLRRQWPDAADARPPSRIRTAIERIRALLAGQPADLSTIPLDMTGVPRFDRRVYEAARRIPQGRTLSYGEVAARAGSPGAARAVGQALSRNPLAIVVPCHRVLAAGGRIGGFSAHGGVTTKARLLWIEGALSFGRPQPVRPPGGTADDAPPA